MNTPIFIAQTTRTKYRTKIMRTIFNIIFSFVVALYLFFLSIFWYYSVIRKDYLLFFSSPFLVFLCLIIPILFSKPKRNYYIWIFNDRIEYNRTELGISLKVKIKFKEIIKIIYSPNLNVIAFFKKKEPESAIELRDFDNDDLKRIFSFINEKGFNIEIDDTEYLDGDEFPKGWRWE